MRQALQLRLRSSLGLAIAMVIASPGFAQIWTGAVNGTWNTAGNWSGGIPASNQNTALTFGASPVTVLSNNIPGTLQLNNVTFTNAAVGYQVTGNAIDYRTSSGAVPPTINFNSTNNIIFNLQTTLTNNLTVRGSGVGTLFIGSNISGPGGITMEGAGNLTLASGTNSFAGGVTIDNGTVQLGAGTAVPAGSAVTINGGQYNISSLSNAAVSALGTMTVNTGGTFRVPSGSGDYFVNQLAMGGGTVDLTGTTAFDLHFTGAAAGISVSADSIWTGAGTSRVVNDTASPLPITLSSSRDLSSTIRLANGSSGQGFRITGAGSLELNNTTGNTADLIVDGSGASIVVSDMAALGSGTLTLTNQGRLLYTGPTATSAKPIILDGSFGGHIALPGGANLTLTGLITENAATKGLAIVFGTVTLAGANSFSGGVDVFGSGTLSVGTINNLGTSGPLGTSTHPTGNLILGTVSGSIGSFQYTGPTATTDRGFTVNNATAGGILEVTNAGTAITFTGPVTGPGRLVKTGPGTLVLTNTTNDYAAGTFVNGGTLLVGAHGAVIPAGSNVTVASGGIFDTGGTNNFSDDLGTVTLDGGTLRTTTAAGGFYFMNQLVTGPAGGIVNLANTSPYFVLLSGTGAEIAVNGNSAWVQAINGGGLENQTASEIALTIAPGVTLTNSVVLNNGVFDTGFRITGGGTLEQTAHTHVADLTIGNARYRTSNVTAFGGNGFLTSLGLTFDGGTLEYTGGTPR